MNLRMNPSSLRKIFVKFVEVVSFQQTFRLDQPPTLLKTNRLIGVFQVFTEILTTVQEILVATSVIFANALETRKKWNRQLT